MNQRIRVSQTSASYVFAEAPPFAGSQVLAPFWAGSLRALVKGAAPPSGNRGIAYGSSRRRPCQECLFRVTSPESVAGPEGASRDRAPGPPNENRHGAGVPAVQRSWRRAPSGNGELRARRLRRIFQYAVKSDFKGFRPGPGLQARDRQVKFPSPVANAAPSEG